jgi:hypothetical protein
LRFVRISNAPFESKCQSFLSNILAPFSGGKCAAMVQTSSLERCIDRSSKASQRRFGPSISNDAQVKLQQPLKLAGIEFLDESGVVWRSASKSAQAKSSAIICSGNNVSYSV